MRGAEDKMSESYHEIFESQLYRTSRTESSRLEADPRSGTSKRSADEREATLRIDGEAARDATSPQCSRDAISPLSDPSEHSGSTETGQPIVPKVRDLI